MSTRTNKWEKPCEVKGAKGIAWFVGQSDELQGYVCTSTCSTSAPLPSARRAGALLRLRPCRTGKQENPCTSLPQARCFLCLAKSRSPAIAHSKKGAQAKLAPAFTLRNALPSQHLHILARHEILLESLQGCQHGQDPSFRKRLPTKTASKGSRMAAPGVLASCKRQQGVIVVAGGSSRYDLGATLCPIFPLWVSVRPNSRCIDCCKGWQ